MHVTSATGHTISDDEWTNGQQFSSDNDLLLSTLYSRQRDVDAAAARITEMIAAMGRMVL